MEVSLVMLAQDVVVGISPLLGFPRGKGRLEHTSPGALAYTQLIQHVLHVGGTSESAPWLLRSRSHRSKLICLSMRDRRVVQR